ncbi:MAG TPA: hypothetical protein VN622_05860 [Clostridia bacterium]|nr:hypothetical protein [Clostridia bacterium]
MKHKKKEAAPQHIKIADIKTEPVPPEVEAIAQPYVQVFAAVISGKNQAEALEAVKALPYEKRYITRVLNALTLAFCDFDDASLKLDFACLTHEQLQFAAGEIAKRAGQFNVLIKAFSDSVGGAE